MTRYTPHPALFVLSLSKHVPFFFKKENALRQAQGERGSFKWRQALPVLGALALSACGEIVPPPRPVSFTPATPRPSAQQLQAAPQPQANGVIGVDARALIKAFGEPRLDIRDPAARKLQFSDGRCILDAYLYPARDRKEPVVTYAEARKSDGTQMEWTACANQLRSR